MLSAIKYTEDLESLEELALLKNQVEDFRLRDKHGKQYYHQNTTKIFQSRTKTIKNTSEILTKTLTETCFNDNKAIEELGEKLLERLNDKGMIAPYLASSLVNLFKPRKKSI